MVRRGREFIQLPGPTNIPERVLRAMNRPMTDFASPEFNRLTRSCLEDLKRVFQTGSAVYAYVSLGHGAWEVPLDNFLQPGDRVLMPDTGRFSLSWKEMADAQRIEVVSTEPFHRRAVDPAAIEEILRDDRSHSIKAVFVVQVETSTGIIQDIAGLRRAIDAAGHPALLVVDAIASLGCVDLPMDEWGVDCVLTASQKGLMLPPGMAFVAVSEKAQRAAEANDAPRRYWDWRIRKGEETYLWFYGTPPETMLYGLRESLDMLFEEGLEAVFARHARLAGAVRAAVGHWGQEGEIEFQASEPKDRSDVVTALRFTSGFEPDKLRLYCRDTLSVAFGAGIGPFAGQLLRIGHLGDLNEPMILGALAALETGMRHLGVPHVPGGVGAAVARLADTMPR